MGELSETLFAKLDNKWFRVAKMTKFYIIIYNSDGDKVVIDEDEVEEFEVDIG